jgi:hypothetical protein
MTWVCSRSARHKRFNEQSDKLAAQLKHQSAMA